MTGSDEGQGRVQNPFNVFLPIQKGHTKALGELVKGSRDTVRGALDDIGTVHFARFMFLDNGQTLGIITAFDGDFDRYVDAFLDKLFGVFNALLEHVAIEQEYLPLVPVEQHRETFKKYVKDHHQDSTLYSAYPDLTVLKIRQLAGS